MSNFINAEVEKLREHLKINFREISYLETRLDRAKKDNEKLEKENKYLKEENKKLKEKLSEVTMIADDEKQSIEHILELEEENKKLKKENEELKDAMKELNNYNKFLIQENERLKSKTITVTDEDNRIILEKGEDGRRHSYGGGNVVLC